MCARRCPYFAFFFIIIEDKNEKGQRFGKARIIKVIHFTRVVAFAAVGAVDVLASA